MSVQRRAFTLIEILVVVAILAVLAAFLFPVFARAKERAKLTGCGERLHQFASALVLYRSDHDDRGFVWSKRDDGNNGFQAPYNMFVGMKEYLGDGSMLWCPEPLRIGNPGTLWNLYFYPAYYIVGQGDLPGARLYAPPRPDPGTVVAYCQNHTGNEPDPRPDVGSDLRIGFYPFVREDTSFGLVRNDQIRLGYFDNRTFYDEPSGTRGSVRRFPGAPWPPVPER